MAEPRATVWVDRSALSIEIRLDREIASRAVPEADTAIGHLVDAGCRVVFVGPCSDTPPVDGEEHDAAVEATDMLPDDAAGWLLTSDSAQCGRARQQRRLRTILIGPSTPGISSTQRVADLEARGLVDAVLTVLSADAMPDPARVVGH